MPEQMKKVGNISAVDIQIEGTVEICGHDDIAHTERLIPSRSTSSTIYSHLAHGGVMRNVKLSNSRTPHTSRDGKIRNMGEDKGAGKSRLINTFKKHQAAKTVK
jgi:hypothetical protein